MFTLTYKVIVIVKRRIKLWTQIFGYFAVRLQAKFSTIYVNSLCVYLSSKRCLTCNETFATITRFNYNPIHSTCMYKNTLLLWNAIYSREQLYYLDVKKFVEMRILNLKLNWRPPKNDNLNLIL